MANASHALIVGGGFIGLEMADQVLPPLDPEMAGYAAERLISHGVSLGLREGVAAFDKRPERGLNVRHPRAKRSLPTWSSWESAGARIRSWRPPPDWN